MTNRMSDIGRFQEGTPPTLPVGEFELRPLRIGDEHEWLSYLADPRVREHTSIPRADLATIRQSVERHIAEYHTGDSCRWALARRDGSLVGTCGFSTWSLLHAHAELVYDLAPALWGQGLMSHAVETVIRWAFVTASFNRIHAFVMTTNQRSIALLDRCHFTREGTLHAFRVAHGRPRDFHVYARLRTDLST